MVDLGQYGIRSTYAQTTYRAPDGTPLKAPAPTPTPSGAGNKPTAKPLPGQGINVDTGLSPAQAAAQAESDRLIQRQAQASGDLAYVTERGLPGYVAWSYGGARQDLGIVQSMARYGLITPQKATAKTYTKYTAFDALKSMPQDQVDALRDRLFQAGFYDDSFYSGKNPRTPAKGSKVASDFDTIEAFDAAFNFAANTQQSIDEVLMGGMGVRRLAEGQKAAARERAPLVIQLTSDEELGEIFREAAMKKIGRIPTPAEVGAFVFSYHGVESSAQQQAYTASGSGLPGGPGGTVMQPAAPGQSAEAQLRGQHPVEYGVQRGEQGLDVLKKLFYGGGG